MFTIEVSSDIDNLLADSAIWDELSRGVPFRQSSWIGPWWRHFGEGLEAYVVIARTRSGQIGGLLPLYRRKSGPNGRALAIMGDGDACSDYVSVLAHEQDIESVAHSIGCFLANNATSPQLGWDLLDIDGVVEGDVGMTALAHGLKSAGATLHGSSRMSTWYKPADASWEDHLKHFSKTERRKHRRMREKIGEDALFQHRLAQTTQQTSELVDDLISMHQQRWNEVGEKGSYADPRFRRFIHDVATEFLASDSLHLNSLQHQGKTVAAELNLVGGNGIIYSFSSGFDVDHIDLEAGRVLRVETLCHLYRESLVGIDFMRGDEEYKRRCTTQSRRVIRMRAGAPTMLPRLRHAAWCTSFEVKQWVRRQTGREPIAVLDLTAAPTTAVLS